MERPTEDPTKDPISNIPSEILRVIIDKLQPVDLMIMCMSSKSILTAAYTPDLRGRRLVEEAARHDTPHLLEYALSLGPATAHSLSVAAEYNNIPAWQILARCASEHSTPVPDNYAAAFRNGSLDVIKLIYPTRKLNRYRTIHDEHVEAVRRGHLHITEWVFSTHVITSDYYWSLVHNAALSHNLDTIKWFQDHSYDMSDYAHEATESGDLKIVQWYIKNFPSCTQDITETALNRGNTHVLDWLHGEGKVVIGLHSPPFALGAFEWLESHGYLSADNYTNIINQWNIPAFNWAKSHNLDVPEYAIERVIDDTKLKLFRVLIANGQIVMNDATVEMIIDHGGDRIFDAVHEFGYPLIDHVERAVGRCRIALKWMCNHGAVLTPNMYTVAATKNSVCAIRILIEHGCPLSADVFAGVVRVLKPDSNDSRTDPIAIMKYLRRAGCPWDGRVCFEASLKNRSNITEWLHRKGCPCCSTCNWIPPR